MPRFEFCDELDAPEICVILDTTWWYQQHLQVKQWFAEVSCTETPIIASNMLFIGDEKLRTMFMLRWG